MPVELLNIPAITIDTTQMMNNWFDCHRDMVWDQQPDMFDRFAEMGKALLNGDVDRIRQAFADGDTPLLLLNDMKDLDTPNPDPTRPEVRITHKGKLLCVLLDDDMEW